ncbi:DUF1903-domain-containing protein [Coprinopsis sp. MPI-PUGE-AT-0042]|nr:DUF1903-domain-containing protein [Coprinopsis sp. MPI-PUGE-AT-0042]
MAEQENACQAEGSHDFPYKACQLQTCLNKNTYKPEKCDQNLCQLYECCQRFYQQNKNGAESTACPIEPVVKRWLKDHHKS